LSNHADDVDELTKIIRGMLEDQERKKEQALLKRDRDDTDAMRKDEVERNVFAGLTKNASKNRDTLDNDLVVKRGRTNSSSGRGCDPADAFITRFMENPDQFLSPQTSTISQTSEKSDSKVQKFLMDHFGIMEVSQFMQSNRIEHEVEKENLLSSISIEMIIQTFVDFKEQDRFTPKLVGYGLTSLDTDKIFFCFTKAIKEKY
jgi:hypothetical protein